MTAAFFARCEQGDPNLGRRGNESVGDAGAHLWMRVGMRAGMTSSIATAWHRLAAIVLAIPLLGPLPALAQEETSLLPFTAD
ncbi:MAG: hypothetical protein O3A38_01695, partial [Proteobacteria bacterium]|nr:hypothetical protein [Pseudomonadota bacterium]